MNRADVTELHYITAIANLPSIMAHGILSHTLADRLAHDSVAMPEIQERRKNTQIPGARSLHEYANLYFDAHNPMLSKCRGRNGEICVLQVNAAVLDEMESSLQTGTLQVGGGASRPWLVGSALLAESGYLPIIGCIRMILTMK